MSKNLSCAAGRENIMKKTGLSQETLKIIACVTMLIDHVGASVVETQFFETPSVALSSLYFAMRIIGRVAFPIYCFLLAEGAHYTRSPRNYAIRLSIGVLLSELPFDFALFGGLTWAYQSVMVTLLLGFGMLELMKKCPKYWMKLLAVIPFALAAQWLNTDYGGYGVAVVALFGLTRELPHCREIQLVGLSILCILMNSAEVSFGAIEVPIELFAVFSMIPICLYSGRKATASKAVQLGFYLFYPVHLAVLAVVMKVCY